jgi:PAS domain S-box-containing protein
MKAFYKSVASIAGAALLVALVVVASFWAFEQTKSAAVARKHTYEVIDRANVLLSALKDAETGERGYALTGDKSFLGPYLAVRDSVGGQLAELRRLASIGAASKQLNVIAPLMDAKMAELSQVIELRRANNMTAVLAVVADGQGKGLMDSIRVEMSGFIQMESDALARHDAAFQSNMRHLFAIIVTASLLTLLFVLLFAYLIHRETEHRLKHQVHLETLHLLEVQEETNKQLQQANATLQVSEEKFAVTLNSIGDGVIATNAEGKVMFLNPVAEQLTGWTQAEAINRPVDEIFHIINEETRQPATIPVMACLAKGTIQGLANHTVLIARDGSECAIADSCAPIRDRDGQRVGAVLVFRDVTKRNQAEEDLRHLNRELRAITNCNQILMRAEDEQTLLNDICRVICDEAGYQMVWVGYAENDEAKTIRNIAWAGPENGYLEQARLTWADTERGRGPCGTAIRSGDSACIQDFTADPLAIPWRSAALQYGYRSSIALPLKDENANTFGILSIYSTTPNAFIPEETRLLKELSGDLAFGIRVLRAHATRIQAEEALLKGGALQVAIFNSANFSSIATDAKGVIQIFNVGAERMLGYAAADVMNKITPADISDPQEVIARAKALSVELSTPITPGFEALVFKASRGIEDIYELTYIRKDGSRFPAVVSVTALRDAQNAIIGYLLIGTDNTARKMAEAALLKAGALQSAIFNSANFSSIATDAKGVIQIFNVGAERMLGYAAADVMNQITPADISDPQEVIVRAKALSLELDTTIKPGFEALVFKASRGIEDIYELTYIRKDGSRFPAVVSVTALRDAQNAIIGYLLIGTDNTARKQVEAEQKQLDQRLRDQQFYTRSLIESNIDALMMADPLGIITDVNKQMEALTGCTRDELIGAPFKKYFTDPERAEASIKLALNGKKVTNYELTARARDGRETVVSYNATTFYDRDRKLQGVFAAARDVTERKRFDLALQETNIELENAKSAAEKANLAKSDFLSSMSHELRSPLNAILGFAQLMESATPPPAAAQAESISQILQAGWHLLKLINEILDLSVIESGKVSLSPESVSLAEVMSECQAMMEPQAQPRGVRMTFPKFGKSIYVKADRTRLKQIIINLLSNAIKYNKEKGSVVVDCTANTPGYIRISVADTGAGLPAEKLAQLFQPFNRLGQEAGGVAGTGIGLVVTRRLTELMEGILGVESTVGVGSVFWCELHSATAPQLKITGSEIGTPAPPPLPAGAPLRSLLYVEDNPANMKLVEQLIARRPDIRLLTAVNGQLGIDLARTALPQVILMDVNLPGISGIEALKILRTDPLTAHIPIVALSANAMPRDIATGLNLGFFRYLTKPIIVKEFMDTLNAALEFAETRNSRNGIAPASCEKNEDRRPFTRMAQIDTKGNRLVTGSAVGAKDL